MPRIILILLALAFIFYLIYRYRRLDPLMQKKLIKLLLVALVSSLLIVMVLTGRLNWLIAAIGALLPLIPRAARFFMGAWPSLMPYFKRYQQNRQSNMQARFIRLQIDMLTGKLQGEVLEGDFAGQKLQMMSQEQLLQLLEQCKLQDAESAALLMAYLDREEPDWVRGDKGSFEQPVSDGEMSEQQARGILGLSE